MSSKLSKYRQVIYYKDYFLSFFESQREKVQKKISWTIDLIEQVERVPELYLKHLENADGLMEVRVQHGSDIFRIFCILDEGEIVVLINGFQKKTNKTPQEEILKALRIKQDYEREKKQRHDA